MPRLLRSAQAPSELLLSIKRRGSNALDRKAKGRLHAAEEVLWAVQKWKEDQGLA